MIQCHCESISKVDTWIWPIARKYCSLLKLSPVSPISTYWVSSATGLYVSNIYQYFFNLVFFCVFVQYWNTAYVAENFWLTSSTRLKYLLLSTFISFFGVKSKHLFKVKTIIWMHPTARIPLFVPDPPFLTKPDRAQSYTSEIVLNLIHVTCNMLHTHTFHAPCCMGHTDRSQACPKAFS